MKASSSYLLVVRCQGRKLGNSSLSQESVNRSPTIRWLSIVLMQPHIDFRKPQQPQAPPTESDGDSQTGRSPTDFSRSLLLSFLMSLCSFLSVYVRRSSTGQPLRGSMDFDVNNGHHARSTRLYGVWGSLLTLLDRRLSYYILQERIGISVTWNRGTQGT